jgi:RND family efflux transporter MFP subunit
MFKLGRFLILITTLNLGTMAFAQSLGCLIMPSEVVELGSPVVGVIERIDVERGDSVKKGQSVAQLTTDVERASVAVAEARASNQAELQAASSTQEFAKRKQERTDSLYRDKFTSLQNQDQAQTEAALAELKLLQAREQKRLSSQELSLARAQLSQRTIKSPISGIIIERYVSQGERVEERPVLRIAALDPLRVEVIAPASEFNKIRAGMIANVTPELANLGERKAKVILVDKILDAASNTFRVRLELPNPNNALPAGLRCKIAIGADNLAQGESKPKAPTAPAPALTPRDVSVSSVTTGKAKVNASAVSIAAKTNP